MGEIADSIINGDFDSITGEYLGEGDGFPRTRIKSQEKPRDIVSNYNGISNYIGKYHPKLVTYTHKEHNKALNQTHRLIREFLREMDIKHNPSNQYGNIWKNASKVQEYWLEFKEFLKRKDQ